MKSKFTFLIGLASTAAMVSCYPPQPPNPDVTDAENLQQEVTEGGELVENAVDPTDEGLSEEAKKQQEYVREQAKKAEQAKVKVTPKVTPPATPKITQPKVTPPTPTPSKIIPDPIAPKPVTYPYASSVPNKPGFVFNPYTQSQVDVRGLASGTLVTDPRDKNQKFYVP